MKKKNKVLITQIFAIGIILLSISFGEYLLYVKEGFLGLWIILTIYLNFIRIPNLKEKTIYLSTQNDNAIVHQNLILGSAIIIGGAVYYYFDKEINLFLSLLMFQAILLIFLNFYKKQTTKGLHIKIEDDELSYVIGKTDKTLKLSEIQKIDIKPSEIIISRDQNKKNYLSFLDLNKDEIKEISSFLRSSKPDIQLNIES